MVNNVLVLVYSNSFLLSIGIHIHILLYELVSVVPRLFIEYSFCGSCGEYCT